MIRSLIKISFRLFLRLWRPFHLYNQPGNGRHGPQQAISRVLFFPVLSGVLRMLFPVCFPIFGILLAPPFLGISLIEAGGRVIAHLFLLPFSPFWPFGTQMMISTFDLDCGGRQ